MRSDRFHRIEETPMFRSRRTAASAVLLSVGLVAQCTSAYAQADPRQVLREVIRQFQTGTPNPLWYGVQVWQTAAYQTANSGVYPQLVALGAVTKVHLNQQQQLQGGMLYNLTADHKNGASTWLLGVGAYSNRIEYLSFNINDSNPSGSNASPADTDIPAPSNPGTQQKGSEACKKFPQLCP